MAERGNSRWEKSQRKKYKKGKERDVFINIFEFNMFEVCGYM